MQKRNHLLKNASWGAPLLLLLGSLLIGDLGSTVRGQSIDVRTYNFSEERTVRFTLASTERAAAASARARVEVEEGQSRLELQYDELKPAVLFGGDITTYVVWAIGRDGAWENLGELAVSPDDRSDSLRFSTALRTFGLLITAEPYYEVSSPSDLALFYSQGSADPPVRGTTATVSDFATSPEHIVEDLDTVAYDSEKPLELIQAERIFEQAREMGAEEYAPDIFSDARTALFQARSAYDRAGSDEAVGYARRSVSALNDAIRLTSRKKTLEQIERQVAQRQAQMEELQGEVREARNQIEEIRDERQQVQAALEQARSQMRQVEQERAMLREELTELQTERERLQGTVADLVEQREELQVEKASLQTRLRSALSEVAETRQTARGYLVNLPDILFDLGEATLKQPAVRALSKLAGILLIMDELEVKVEGHTDSTGSPSLNQRLSRERADAVFDLLVEEGISPRRLETEGFGSQKPVASNETREGRRQNRRVELVISEDAASGERAASGPASRRERSKEAE